MIRRDNAPIHYTCPDIDSVIETLAGVADRLNTISDRLCCPSLDSECNDIYEQCETLRNLFKGKQSPIEKLRNANESLRDWGNELVEQLDDAKAECQTLGRRIDDLEVM